MTTTVHMIYTGIISFVKDREGRIHVVVQDASSHQHIPYIIVERALGRVEKMKELLPDEERPWSAFALTGGVMKIDNEIESDDLEPDDNLHLVLPFRAACHPDWTDCSNFRDGLLQGVPWSQIAVRGALSRGLLRASWVDPRWKWRFKGQGDNEERWLAQEVCHSFEIAGDELKLRFAKTTHGGDSKGGLVTLGPDADEASIEVRIGNTFEEDTFGDAGWVEAEKEDPHVKLYHELSAEETPDEFRRVLVKVSARDVLEPPQDSRPHRLDGGHIYPLAVVRGANCPPARWWSLDHS